MSRGGEDPVGKKGFHNFLAMDFGFVVVGFCFGGPEKGEVTIYIHSNIITALQSAYPPLSPPHKVHTHLLSLFSVFLSLFLCITVYQWVLVQVQVWVPSRLCCPFLEFIGMASASVFYEAAGGVGCQGALACVGQRCFSKLLCIALMDLCLKACLSL